MVQSAGSVYNEDVAVLESSADDRRRVTEMVVELIAVARRLSEGS